MVVIRVQNHLVSKSVPGSECRNLELCPLDRFCPLWPLACCLPGWLHPRNPGPSRTPSPKPLENGDKAKRLKQWR